MRIAAVLLALLPISANAGPIIATWGQTEPFPSSNFAYFEALELVAPIVIVKLPDLPPPPHTVTITQSNAADYNVDWAALRGVLINTDGRTYKAAYMNLVNIGFLGLSWQDAFPHHTPGLY